jgi:hypothetical protein
MEQDRAREFIEAWVWVPMRFWVGVWVGWRMRMLWVKRRMAVEFRSCL